MADSSASATQKSGSGGRRRAERSDRAERVAFEEDGEAGLRAGELGGLAEDALVRAALVQEDHELGGAFQYCHCSRCRKNSGSAHAANIFVPAGQLVWEQGESQVRRFELPTARYWCCAFCTTCGARMPWRTKSGKMFIVPAGALDEDPGARPARNVHFASRAPWYVAASDLETHDTEPPGR